MDGYVLALNFLLFLCFVRFARFVIYPHSPEKCLEEGEFARVFRYQNIHQFYYYSPSSKRTSSSYPMLRCQLLRDQCSSPTLKMPRSKIKDQRSGERAGNNKSITFNHLPAQTAGIVRCLLSTNTTKKTTMIWGLHRLSAQNPFWDKRKLSLKSNSPISPIFHMSKYLHI